MPDTTTPNTVQGRKLEKRPAGPNSTLSASSANPEHTDYAHAGYRDSVREIMCHFANS